VELQIANLTLLHFNGSLGILLPVINGNLFFHGEATAAAAAAAAAAALYDLLQKEMHRYRSE